MDKTTAINEQLRNVFDADSISAIRNAGTITPPPEKIHAQKTEEAEEPKESERSSDDNNSINNNNNNNSDNMKKEIEALQKYISEQENRITILINSQNELIKEFNKLEKEIKEIKNRPQSIPESKPETKKEEKLTVSEEKQQTGAGEGLKNEEYSVEKFFYFGKK